MQDHSPYDRPELYDLIAPPDAAMERFYIGMVRMYGDRVLDLACGSGRFSIPLALAGAQVVAGDLSRAMLHRARLAAEAQGVAIEWHQLDMRDFALDRQFDAIILAGNSIMHLHSADDFECFFRSVARHLSPEGRLVFDTFLPNLALLAGPPDRRHRVGRFGAATWGNLTLEETVRYEPVSQISHVTWYWSSKGENDFWVTPLQLRQIFPQEMPLLVASGGLRLVERFGDFDCGPLAAGSHRQISVCAKA